jgi:hypothetical protein
MKKCSSILVLGFFLFNTMGYYFVYKVNQSIIQSEIRNIIRSGIHEEMYILVKVEHPADNPDFRLLDHNEFSYCGKLYDIASETVKENVTWYYCINDKQEERLIAGFEKIQDLNPVSGPSDKTKHTMALLYHLVTIALVKEPVVFSYPQPLKVIFGYTPHHPSTSFQIPLSPPPELS